MKQHRRSITATAIALTLAASSALAGTSRGFENGGYFKRFDPVVAEFNQNGNPFRIVGLCQSACTLFLSIRNVCIEPRATFQFHAGNDGNGNISQSATEHMLNAYSPKLRRFVIENGYMRDFTFHTISGIDMIEKFGYPVCNAEHRLADAEGERDTGQASRSARTNEGSFKNLARQPQRTAMRGMESSFSPR